MTYCRRGAYGDERRACKRDVVKFCKVYRARPCPPRSRHRDHMGRSSRSPRRQETPRHQGHGAGAGGSATTEAASSPL
eukprot:667567-Pyramimonas_sp.AAC.1